MGFESIYRAIYDYTPQGEGELELSDGDLLFVLDRSADDGWWKAKKKAANEDEEEPEGLIPNNYVEEATPSHKAKALYDYTRQTDEELSFTEESVLDVYDTTDPDWTLVGLNGEFGFVPANYIEEVAAGEATAPAPPPMPPRQPAAAAQPSADVVAGEASDASSDEEDKIRSPAAALAGILAQKTGGDDSASKYSGPSARPVPSPPQEEEDRPALPSRSVRFAEAEEEEEEEAPRLPRRPPSTVSPPPMSPTLPTSPISEPRSAPRDNYGGSYRLFNIWQVKSALGKEHKIRSVLGIDVRNCRIMISEVDSGGGKKGKEQLWDGSQMTNYSIEGKRVFIVVVRPSHEFHIHAGNTETAEEITRMLGEISGAVRSQSEYGAIAEILEAAQGSGRRKTGVVKFDFAPNDDDEIAVLEGDQVEILDDRSSDEWWKVMNLRTRDEGVVPAQYVEITMPSADLRSEVEKNRAEEDRQARAALKKGNRRSGENGSVGPGMHLPKRGSSLMREDSSASRSGSQRRSKRASGRGEKPNPEKIRQWTDRTGSFKVDAEFLGLRDGKIHLHKLNGVRIAVPVSKMSMADIEYVERVTGVSLDEDKPLSEIRRRNSKRISGTVAGATVERSNAEQYDWFDFFLACGVNPQICERYNNAFKRDQMGEENMEDISPQTLRTLGVKEGDILRIMKHLDAKFMRNRDTSAANGSVGGLFSGSGGALLNNTKKGRPAPPVETNNTVDADAFKPRDEQKEAAEEVKPAPRSSTPTQDKAGPGGFDDNAWEPRATKAGAPTTAAPAATPAAAPPAPAPAITGSLAELSLLTPALEPTPAPKPQPTQPATPPADAAPAQPAGATPSLFEKLAQAPPQPLPPQQTGFQPGLNISRQRPAPPQQMSGNSLIAPPPARASSAPNAQQNAFQPPPLQPQLTGYQQPGIMHAQPSGPGQSMLEMNQQKMAQQYAQLQAQQTGFPGQFGPNGMPMGYVNAPYQQAQPTGFQQPMVTGMQPQPTGFPMNTFGNQTGSPFADPPRAPFQPQPTGFQPSFSPQPLQPQATGINAFLPPALQPQPTGFQANQNPGFQAPPVPPIPQNPTGIQPLQPQKTGPPPPVRFGVSGAKKLAPQPTGRRANLSQATPDNPFGF